MSEEIQQNVHQFVPIQPEETIEEHFSREFSTPSPLVEPVYTETCIDCNTDYIGVIDRCLHCESELCNTCLITYDIRTNANSESDIDDFYDYYENISDGRSHFCSSCYDLVCERFGI